MRVHIATDHAAFELKEYLVKELEAREYEVVDHGNQDYEAADDYPVYVIPCAEAVAAEPGSLGVVLGGSGNGEQIAANKVKGIRAALAYNPELAKLGRQHNNANCVALGGRMQPMEQSLQIVLAFLETPWTNEERHSRRLAMLARYEETGSIY